ncbi:MAG TPA: GNAT family N-acetyltransferase [Methylomirabilota bacterium]|nr:GNAT family N-acetyltransferase [Methylomirabilota bacterium]
MTYTACTLAERPSLRPRFGRFHDRAWPEFLRDTELNRVFGLIYEHFPEFQLGLFDGAGRLVAIGNSIPFPWNGRPASLPDRIVDVVTGGIRAKQRGRRPTALSALAAIVDPRFRGRDLSRRVIVAMRRLAERHRLAALVAPVRPTAKGRYPVTPMDDYVAWRRPDGAPLDPWLRVHWRLGARVVRIARRAMTVTATVAEWEARTGLRFPESGRYVVPGAFNPVTIDRRRNRGRYVEPNVWMRHPVRRIAPSARR